MKPANETRRSSLSALEETSIAPSTPEGISTSVWMTESRSRAIYDQRDHVDGMDVGIVSVCWSQDGKWIISGDTEGRIQFYDEALKVLFVQFAHSEPGSTFCTSLN